MRPKAEMSSRAKGGAGLEACYEALGLDGPGDRAATDPSTDPSTPAPETDPRDRRMRDLELLLMCPETAARSAETADGPETAAPAAVSGRPEAAARQVVQSAAALFPNADWDETPQSVAMGARQAMLFDAHRSAELRAAAAEMGCAPEDVVVTALDWYLDALAAEYGDE